MIAIFEILQCTERGKWIHLRAQHCQNYQLYQKIVQIKVIENSISYEKVSGRTCLSVVYGNTVLLFIVFDYTQAEKFVSYRF